MTEIISRDQRKNLSEAQKLEQFNALLQADISDIETLPEYATFPAGTYVFHVAKCSVDTEKRMVIISMALDAMAALANEAEAGEVPVEGSLYAERYNFDYDGIERLKKVFGAVFESQGWRTPAQLIEGLQGMSIVCTLNKRKDKKDATKVYNGIVEAAELPSDVSAG